MTKLRNQTRWALLASLALVLVFALGCSASDEPAPSAAPATGNQVGDQIHPFTLRLADGSILTSAQILERKNPTFMLFHKNP